MEQLALDQFGRVEIPEKIRQQLGIDDETKLSLKVENGQLILKPLNPELEIYYEDGILVFKAEPMANTETIIDELRTERINELISW
jgi:bifunctional DNA-binding transcriptional regulator/antitoxin component of YhaV-PrlF toxin-antitoxin module